MMGWNKDVLQTMALVVVVMVVVWVLMECQGKGVW